jgi:hypothetical protein
VSASTPRVSQTLPTPLGGGQGRFDVFRDRFPLVLGHGGQNVNGELVGVRVIHRHELNAAFHERGIESEVARKPVELGDNELGLLPLASGNSLFELFAVGGNSIVRPGALRAARI